MSIANNNILTPFAWYTDKKYQDRYKSYGYGEIFPLISPNGKLLPFQFITNDYSAPSITKELIKVNADGSEESPVTLSFSGTGADMGDFAIYHYDGANLLSPLAEGRYYLHLRFEQGGTTENFYSEVFTVVNDVSNFLKLEWWDESPLVMDGGAIYYNGSNYKNTIYLPTEVGKPIYDFTEEGSERNGYFFAEKQISRKKYQFNFLAPEYLCDALRLSRMHDYIKATCNGIEYEINQIEFNVEWQEQGNLASVTAQFYCSTVAKVIGKSTPFLTGGDYNDDFNDDYNNE